MTQQEEQDLKTYLDAKFAGIDAKFAGMDAKFGGVNQRLDGLEHGQAKIDAKFAGINQRLQTLEQGQAKIEQHLDKQDADLEHRTLSILQTIEASTQESKLRASRLFALLDEPDAGKAKRRS